MTFVDGCLMISVSQLSENSVAWLESDIAAWADSRPIAHLRGTPASGAQARRLNYD
jgi:hypothetical protein